MKQKSVEHEFDKYDIEFLVDQYEILRQIYVEEQTLSKQSILKMKKLFGLYDFDNSGMIDREECKKLV